MTTSDRQPTPSPLDGTSWQLVWPSGTRSTIAFAEGRAFGSAGVNRYMGSASVEGARLTLGPLAVTRMAGPSDAMADEDAFLAALASATSWAIDETRLALLDDGGDVQLALDPDPAGGPT